MSCPIGAYERPQVKAILHTPAGLFLAAETGLYQLVDKRLQPHDGWLGRPLQQLASCGDGFLVLVEDQQGQNLYRCDAHWQVINELPCPAGEKIKCLYFLADSVLAGTKRGVFALRVTPDGAVAAPWQCLFQDALGWGEVLWINSDRPGHIRASVKKYGADAKPALIESQDQGQSWSITPVADYQDIVLAANDRFWVSRWRGYGPARAPKGYKKHPISAAWLDRDAWAVIDGCTLEYQQQGGAKLAFEHPLLAEAERVCALTEAGASGCFLVAGVQGAYLVQPASGQVADLFVDMALAPGLGKLKRVFGLDDGVLLATATYGSYRSEDDGRTWAPVNSEWAVLDAEHLIRSDDGRWWLGCQRGLFVSADNGMSWRYVKLKLTEAPHYAELRGGLAISGDRLFIGTKTGLLVAPLDNPESVRRVQYFDCLAIEALYTDQPAGHLLVGTHHAQPGLDQLWRYDPVHKTVQAVTAPGEVSVLEAQVVGTLEDALLATGEQLFHLCGGANNTRIVPLTPVLEGAGGDYLLAGSHDTAVVVWNDRQAWQWQQGRLQPLANWPSGVRHACVRAHQSQVLVTDRRQLSAIPLAASSTGSATPCHEEQTLC